MINLDVQDSLGMITLNRPEVHHAINRTMMTQLEEALQELECRKDVKLLILTGQGERSFCSGGDVQEFHPLEPQAISSIMHQMKGVLNRLQFFSKPTIAALNGTAVGGGCEIAAACDFRVAHAAVKLGFIQINLGISTGWGGASRLFQVIPTNKALKWLLSGEVISAADALELGFVDEIFPSEHFLEHVQKWSTRFTKHSLGSLQSYKAAWVDRLQAEQTNLWSRMDREVDRCLELWNSDEHKWAVEQFLQKK